MDERIIPGEMLGKVVVSDAQIRAREEQLAEMICQDLAQANPILLCVKEGAKYFFDDLCALLQAREIPFERGWITTSSYAGNMSTGSVAVKEYQGPELTGRVVVIVEDIIDTALTVKVLANHLLREGAIQVETCALLFKKRRQNWLWRLVGLRAMLGYPPIRYVGMFIGNYFVVGKGLDYDDYGRANDDVRILLPEGQAWVDEQKKKK